MIILIIMILLLLLLPLLIIIMISIITILVVVIEDAGSAACLPWRDQGWGLGSYGQELRILVVSLQLSCFLTGTFWVLPLTYFYIPKSARAYLFPQSVETHYFCSGFGSGPGADGWELGPYGQFSRFRFAELQIEGLESRNRCLRSLQNALWRYCY